MKRFQDFYSRLVARVLAYTFSVSIYVMLVWFVMQDEPFNIEARFLSVVAGVMWSALAFATVELSEFPKKFSEMLEEVNSDRS